MKETSDGGKLRRTLRWTDPISGLELQIDVTCYQDWPVVEWTGYLRNTGKQISPVVKDLLAAEIQFPGAEFTLHGIRGDSCSAKSYQPYEWSPKPKGQIRFFAQGGKSTGGKDGWPYFNLAGSDGSGQILVLGWPGQWSATFLGETSGVNWKAGQELTEFQLEPGEEVRIPSVTMLFWKGSDWILAQNLWRRWYREQVMPKTQGQILKAVTEIQVGGGEANISGIQRCLDAGIQPDICWRDAGDGWWSIPDSKPYTNLPFLNTTGFWEPNPVKFPAGFVPFGDWIRARGMQMLVWFEPERIGYTNSAPNAYSKPVLATQHPEWLLPGGSHGSYFNLGNPTALAWLSDHLNKVVQTQKLDWYREDFNGEGPLKVWRDHDGREKGRTSKLREGLTENFYIQGHLALWDSLLQRNPRLRIDSCASGGRRNDLESMRRAVPLLRSDFEMPEMDNVVEGNQGLTYGLSLWLPFQGALSRFGDPYSYRSFYLPCFGSLQLQKKHYDEARIVAPYVLMGDYYPLTPYSIGKEKWIAWQFHRPDEDSGIIQAFRRKENPSAQLSTSLRGLRPEGRYLIESFDEAVTSEKTGAELMAAGLNLRLTQPRSAGIWKYTPVKK